MIGKFLSIVVLTISLACGGSCSHSPVPDSPKTLNVPSVAKLIILDSDGGREGSCTAWKASATLIVTAGHCCDKTSNYKLEGPNAIPGERIVGLVDIDDQDVCVLHGKMKGPPIRIAANDPPIGSKVWVAGFPRGYYMIGEGYWSGRDTDDRNRAMYSIDAVGGFSGSPVMNTDGEACSILTEGFLGQSVTFGTPLEHIRAALRKAKVTPVPDDEVVGDLKPSESE